MNSFNLKVARAITLASVLVFGFQWTVAQKSSEEKVLMAIFAHPDDEMTVAPILSKYVEEGVKVYLVICTDGRFG